MVDFVASLALVVICYYVVRFLWERLEIENFEKKAVFITGCDTGFGRLLALKCAARGFNVFAGCLTKEGEANLVDENVTKDESVRKAVGIVEKSLPDGVELWALVNNAGVFSCFGPDDWCSVEQYKKSYNINTLGVVRTTQACKPLLKRSKGRIITVTSVVGRVTLPCLGPYGELRPFGITCCILEPGVFKTILWDKLAMENRVDHVWNRLNDEQRKEYGIEFKNNFVKKCIEVLNTFGTSRLDYAIDNYFHAISARFPRLRYRCGWDALFYYGPLAYLPTELEDFMIWLVTRFSYYPPPCGSRN